MRIKWVVATIALAACGAADADSLFSRQVEERGTLVSDNKMRFAVGDVITVLVREDIDARMDSQLDTEKRSEISAEADPADNGTFTGSDALIDLPEGLLPNYDVQAENRHEADGTTRRRNQVVFTVTCAVTKVWPNGNVEIEGEKRVTVNRDDSLIKLSGVARTRDISPQNSLNSNLLSNAVVELKGHGPMWNNQRRGLFTRLLDWFSPF
jgi:flagellar L-ring protein precursor FlgH